MGDVPDKPGRIKVQLLKSKKIISIKVENYEPLLKINNQLNALCRAFVEPHASKLIQLLKNIKKYTLNKYIDFPFMSVHIENKMEIAKVLFRLNDTKNALDMLYEIKKTCEKDENLVSYYIDAISIITTHDINLDFSERCEHMLQAVPKIKPVEESTNEELKAYITHFVTMAHLLEAENRLDEANTVYNRALRISIYNGYLINTCADLVKTTYAKFLLRFHIDKIDKIEQILNSVFETETISFGLRHCYGDLYYAKKQYTKSIQNINMALNKFEIVGSCNSSKAEMYHTLTKCYVRLKDKINAEYSLKRCNYFAKGMEWKKKEREVLSNLINL